MPSSVVHVRSALLASLLTAAAPLAMAVDLNPSALTQAEFRLLSEDMGAIASFKPLIPSEGLGLGGFDIGFGATGTELQNRSVWIKAAGGEDIPSTVVIPTARIHIGLPANFDIGAFYSQAIDADVNIYGGELRWAFVAGSTAMPAIAVRLAGSAVSGVQNLSFYTTSLDLSISKGFAFITPYAGIGIVGVKSKPDSPTLSSESFTQNKFFAGVNVNLGLVNLVFEADQTGDATSYGAKIGFRF